MPAKCQHIGCSRRPLYDVVGAPQPSFCPDHKADDMIIISARTCKHPGCEKYPSYDIVGTQAGSYCGAHKLPGMIDVMSRKCAFPGCATSPSFNYENQTPGQYCARHKTDDMVDVTRKAQCVHPGCLRKYPAFNYASESKGCYCREHKLPDMVCIRRRKPKTCKFENCTIHPSYNYPGLKTEHYCAQHRKDGMVEVKKRVCAFPGCSVCPSFNFVTSKGRKYCATHKEDGMVHVVHRRAEKLNQRNQLAASEAYLATAADGSAMTLADSAMCGVGSRGSIPNWLESNYQSDKDREVGVQHSVLHNDDTGDDDNSDHCDQADKDRLPPKHVSANICHTSTVSTDSVLFVACSSVSYQADPEALSSSYPTGPLLPPVSSATTPLEVTQPDTEGISYPLLSLTAAAETILGDHRAWGIASDKPPLQASSANQAVCVKRHRQDKDADAASYISRDEMTYSDLPDRNRVRYV